MVTDFVDASGKPFPPGLTADEYYKLLEGAELSKSGKAKAGSAAVVGSPGGAAQPCAGECGSGAGNPHDMEAGLMEEARAKGDDAFKASAMSGRSASDQLLTAKAVAIAAKAAAQAGKLPAGLDRWVDGLLALEPIPWPVSMGRALRNWLERAGCGGRTYARPSRLAACLRRRGSSRRILLPAKVARRVRWWLIIDTSGSMDEENVRRGVAYAMQLADKPGAECYVGSCDTQLTPPTLTRTVEDMMDAVKGGGGTSFIPIFELLERTPPDERPDYIAIYTDGHGPAPTSPPDGVNVMWVLSDSNGRPARPATWGTFIELDQP